MILRKPYAFLIKNFKLIHLFFVFLSGYLLYRTYIIHNFFKEARDIKIVTNRELTDVLFNSLMYIFILLILILSIIVIWLLKYKKKKTLLYFLNLFFYIILGVFYYYSYVQTGIMEITAIDIRTIRIIYDLFTISLVLQFISIVGYAVRATGFDIKKFNFGQDIVDLKIDVEDKEEFEVDIDLDINRVNKKFRKKLRFWKYTYVENRFLINLTVCFIITLGALFTVLYMDSNRQFTEKTLIQTTNYIFEVSNSYSTTYDYQNNVINNDKKFVVIKFNIQNKYDIKQELRLGMFELEIGDKLYYPTYDYYEKFVDIGTSYYDQTIDSDVKPYILTYMIDKDDTYEDVSLNFYDGIEYGKSGNNNRIYKIKINVIDLDDVTEIETADLESEISIDNDFIKKGRIKINGYELSNRFKLNYQFCVETNECYNSVEYLVTRNNSNIDKILLKISGTWKMDNKIEGLNNLYDFLRMYGSLTFTKGNQTLQQQLNLGQIVPLKTKEKDTYYLEVPAILNTVETITLNIRTRNTNYAYILK